MPLLIQALSRFFMIGLISFAAGCGGGDEEGGNAPGGGAGGRGGGRGGGSGFGGGPAAEATAIPVRVAAVERRRISDYLQTSGALEAENEVDIVARTSGPITSLLTEEGRYVEAGQILARIDDRELRADMELAQVTLVETKASFDRAQRNFDEQIISAEAFDVTKARFETARAQIRSREIQLSYTEIKAPFSGRVIERAIKQGEFVTNGSRLFRISDFDPLLCQVYLPEKDLVRVMQGQKALVSVEAFSNESFPATVLRINPVIDQSNGTFKVTLQVQGRNRLRPGMFASVFLEVDAHEGALVVPKRALVLEGVGDTVYVVSGELAARREVSLGFEEAAHVEVLSGLAGSEDVIVLGQDSLTDGTPVYILEREGEAAPTAAAQPSAGEGRPGRATERPQGASAEAQSEPSAANGDSTPPAGDAAAAQSGGRGRGQGDRELDLDDPEVVKRIRERMKSFGMSDEQIDERIEQMKRGEAPTRPGGGQRSPGGQRPPGGDGAGAR